MINIEKPDQYDQDDCLLTVDIKLDGLADCRRDPIVGNAHVSAHLTSRHLKVQISNFLAKKLF